MKIARTLVPGSLVALAGCLATASHSMNEAKATPSAPQRRAARAAPSAQLEQNISKTLAALPASMGGIFSLLRDATRTAVCGRITDVRSASRPALRR